MFQGLKSTPIMLSSQILRALYFRPLYFRPLSRPLLCIQNSKAYSSRTTNDDEADLDAARQWFSSFNKTTIPASIAKTTFSRSSGAGGQKVNKYLSLTQGILKSIAYRLCRTSSKATTIWPISSLQSHVPKVFIPELRSCRYYVSSSDSITIQCDSSRSQPENTEETHRKLAEEIKRIYKKRVPGITTPEQKARIEQL
jgi:peptidyl-tRNA hydrolase ICT1